MTRPLRLEIPGAVYHLTSRGNRREAIFRDDPDRATFLATLAHVCERFRWSCHAYCLMTNHYHLVVETADANLSRGMRQLNGVYTKRFNRAHQCVGHVYQGRYSAVLVQRELHLLAVLRYVLLNPVRARMVAAAVDWPWSSYRATIGEVGAPNWLRTDWIAAVFGSGAGRNAAFAQFVEDGVVGPSCWQHLTHQIYLGDAAFVAAVQSQMSDLSLLTEIPRLQRWPVREPLGAPNASDAVGAGRNNRIARNEAIVAAFSTGRHTMREIGDHFGVHYSRVSRIVSEFETLKAARRKT